MMNRRDFLKLTCASTGSLVLGTGVFGYAALHPEKIKAKARIVIVGAGAGGLTTAAQLERRLDGAKITIVDGKEIHHYQPGFTLIGCGVYKPEDVIKQNADYIPANVQWVKEMVAEYNPDANYITTESGKKIPYDYLVVSPGTQMNYDQISGLEEEMLGRNGIGSVYHSPQIAEKTWHEVQRFIKKGGVGLFIKPGGKIKCGGAPLKAAFLTESRARDEGDREKFQFSYLTSKDNLFKIKEINDLCANRCDEKKIEPHFRHTLAAIDADRKVAVFKNGKGTAKLSYDYIHITPPMSAPTNIKNSPLSWKTGKYAKDGWLEVDKYTLQHLRYPNIFGMGDVIGTPIGKTGASVKYQAPAVAQNIVSLLQGKPLESKFNGYTSCLLATGIGCAVVVEFDYSNELTPTLPLLSAKADGLIGWNIKKHVIPALYFQMIQGRIPV